MSITWITAAEASVLLHISLKTVIKRIRNGVYQGKISKDLPYSQDGKPLFLLALESLPGPVQRQYHQRHYTNQPAAGLHLLSARSVQGESYLPSALQATTLIEEVRRIKREYHSTGHVTEKLRSVAARNSMSLATLYKLTGSRIFQDAGKLFEDPTLEMAKIPRTMCLKSIDLAVSLYLKTGNQTDVFRELVKIQFSCKDCEFKENGSMPCRKTVQETIYLPSNLRAVSRLLSSISPQLKYLYQNGRIDFISRYGLFALRQKTMLFGELWEADHTVLSIKVAIRLEEEHNARRMTRILLVHPVVTAFLDTATKFYTGIVLSIIPNSDTIADAFLEGIRTYGAPAHIRTDCGKDYQSIMLQAIPEEMSSYFDPDESFLNRSFAGCGVLSLFGTKVNSAMPYHPQAKPCIERSFRILDGIVQKEFQNSPIVSYDEFANRFFSTVLPNYQNTPWKEEDYLPEEWELDYCELSPENRRLIIPAVRTNIPSQEDLSLLRFHRKDGCKVGANGIHFANCYYYAKELERFTGPDGPKVSIQYNRVTKPLAPQSVTVIYEDVFVCEAFAMERLLPVEENASEYKYFLDSRNHRIQQLNASIHRINRSAEALLPAKYCDRKLPDKKAQLQNMELQLATNKTEEQKPKSAKLDAKRLKDTHQQRQEISNLFATIAQEEDTNGTDERSL